MGRQGLSVVRTVKSVRSRPWNFAPAVLNRRGDPCGRLRAGASPAPTSEHKIRTAIYRDGNLTSDILDSIKTLIR